MRKLIILKTIVDIFWILTVPAILFILFLIPYIWVSDGIDLPINLNGMELQAIDVSSKLVISFILLSFLMLFYNVYLFKRILQYFQKLKIFDDFVSASLNTMGRIFMISAFLAGVPTFLYRLFHLNKFKLVIGFSPFVLLLSLGLFLMILSEIFKIAKDAKRDSELTI